MPRVVVDDNKRMNLRVSPEAKAKLALAATLSHTDLTSFVMQSSLRAADAVIQEAQAIRVSGRDYRRILELLENPPKPNAKLKAAIAALPDTL
jgi:uncharacterized protein (DUF1778 family)